MALTPLCPPPSLVPGDAHGNHPDAKLFFFIIFFPYTRNHALEEPCAIISSKP